MNLGIIELESLLIMIMIITPSHIRVYRDALLRIIMLQVLCMITHHYAAFYLYCAKNQSLPTRCRKSQSKMLRKRKSGNWSFENVLFLALSRFYKY